MSVMISVARNALRHLLRSRIAVTGVVLVALLTLAAAVTSRAWSDGVGSPT